MTKSSTKVKVAIISHVPTTEQGDWILVPEELKNIWGNIPPYGDTSKVEEYLGPILDWLYMVQPDTIWCQGEMTAVAVIWRWARNHGVKAVVATTERTAVETTEPDGSVIKRAVFKHCQFREIPL